MPKDHPHESGRGFDRQDLDRVTLIRFLPQKLVDLEEIDRIGAELVALVDDEGRDRLVFDMARVEYPASAFLGKIVCLIIRLRRTSGRLAICNLSGSLTALLQPSSDRGSGTLAFFDDTSQAIAWAGEP